MKNLGLKVTYTKVTLAGKLYQTNLSIYNTKTNTELLVGKKNLYLDDLIDMIKLSNLRLFLKVKCNNAGNDYVVVSGEFDVFSEEVFFTINGKYVRSFNNLYFTENHTHIDVIESLITFLNKLNDEITKVLQQTIISETKIEEF